MSKSVFAVVIASTMLNGFNRGSKNIIENMIQSISKSTDGNITVRAKITMNIKPSFGFGGEVIYDSDFFEFIEKGIEQGYPWGVNSSIHYIRQKERRLLPYFKDRLKHLYFPKKAVLVSQKVPKRKTRAKQFDLYVEQRMDQYMSIDYDWNRQKLLHDMGKVEFVVDFIYNLSQDHELFYSANDEYIERKLKQFLHITSIEFNGRFLKHTASYKSPAYPLDYEEMQYYNVGTEIQYVKPKLPISRTVDFTSKIRRF